MRPHKRELSRQELRVLEHLLGLALLDDATQQQLLEGDHDLLSKHELCAETQAWIRSIEAETLVELARVLADDTFFPIPYRR
jgi:hypothetical protein